MSCYRFIAAERGHYAVRRLCQVLGVPASGVLCVATGPATGGGEGNADLGNSPGQGLKRRCGTRRLQVAQRHKGHRVGRQRLRTAMRRQGLRALQPTAYTPRTTNSTHGPRCPPNRQHSSIGYQTPYSTHQQLLQTTALNYPA